MRSLTLAFLLAAAIGCQNDASETGSDSGTGSDSTATDTETGSGSGETAGTDSGAAGASGTEGGTTETPVEVSIKTTSFEALREHIAAQKGKVVIVDYWSTSCGPCRKEFPHLVEIHNKYPADQVVCMSASLDFAGLPDMPIEQCSELALEFLKEKNSTLQNFIFEEDDLTIMEEKLDVGSIPVVEVFDTDGQLKKRFDGSSGEEFTYNDNVIPLLEELVETRFQSESTE